MRRPQPDRNCLKDEQYLTSIVRRIKLKLARIDQKLIAGDLTITVALLMAINDDTAEIAAAWEREHSASEP
jgi:hypothetical protein